MLRALNNANYDEFINILIDMDILTAELCELCGCVMNTPSDQSLIDQNKIAQKIISHSSDNYRHI